MSAQLVILAAGSGRRFGGLKQLAAVGPDGETIMDYTVFDAMRSGFDEVVLVIRREMEAAIREHVDRGFGARIPVTFVHQELDAIPAGFQIPAGRTRPWGTAQAVLAAAAAITGPFAVANADDYYGRPAIAALGEFLARPVTTPPTWAMVGFAVADTLPATGEVSRGLVRTRGGFLVAIDEVHTVRRHRDGAVWDAPDGPRVIPGSSLVSMNLWGFGREILAELDHRFRRFLREGPASDAECYLPVVVGQAAAESTARVAVLPAPSRWCGLTSAVDLAVARATMAGFVPDGTFPARLWG